MGENCVTRSMLLTGMCKGYHTVSWSDCVDPKLAHYQQRKPWAEKYALLIKCYQLHIV